MSHSDTSQRAIPYTKQEQEGLQTQLDGMLGPEYVNYRPAPGGSSVAYLRGDVAITLANEIFGFNGWSSEIKEITVDECLESHGKWTVTASVHLRITLKDGTFREDIGTGESQNQRSKSSAIVAAKKQAVTDALKRTFRTFGNALGNCLYDKQHIKGTRRMKAVQPIQEPNYYMPRFVRDRIMKQEIKSEESLVTPSRPESLSETSQEKIISENDLAEGLDEYGGDEYDYLGAFEDGDDYGEHVLVEDMVEAVDDVFKRPTPPTPTGAKSTVARMGGNQLVIAPKNQNTPVPGLQQGQNGQHAQRTSPNIPPQPPAQQSRPYQAQNRGPHPPPQHSAIGKTPLQKPPNVPQGPRTPTPTGQMGSRVNSMASNITHNLRNVQPSGPKLTPPHEIPQSVPILPAPSLNGQPETPINYHTNAHVGFLTSKALLDPKNNQKVLQGDSGIIPPDHAFNPRKESTIPRSAGIDHSKSSPVPRKQIQAGGGTGSPFARKNFENPSSEPHRQIGQPPLPRGTGAFRQPTPSFGGIKRPADTNAPGATSGPGRPTLGDSSETRLNTQISAFGNDPKRVKN
ncbi:hypothetical protein L873DRAFT_1717028 [Choiromyces venosus 120613-1]|uniref:RAD52 homolog n=1 Tax=Choiromyces venosus 120613-1 TaxID=1336337 RepID=A0A3N4J9Z9_9PEZI|nr:hypothetical protein L873DRAFT_1717028 [Choiromyces venosus 120613-1]